MPLRLRLRQDYATPMPLPATLRAAATAARAMRSSALCSSSARCASALCGDECHFSFSMLMPFFSPVSSGHFVTLSFHASLLSFH